MPGRRRADRASPAALARRSAHLGRPCAARRIRRHSVRNRPRHVPGPRQHRRSPDALRRDLSGSTGTVLDPIFSLRCRVTLEPRDRVEITFITLAATSREVCWRWSQKYQRPESVARASKWRGPGRNWNSAFWASGPRAAHRFQELASHLIYPNPRLRPPRTGSRATGWDRPRCGAMASPAICRCWWSPSPTPAACPWSANCCWRITYWRIARLPRRPDHPESGKRPATIDPLRSATAAADRGAFDRRGIDTGRRFPARLARHSGRSSQL